MKLCALRRLAAVFCLLPALLLTACGGSKNLQQLPDDALLLPTPTPAPAATPAATQAPAEGFDLTLDNGRSGLPATICLPSGGQDWPLVVFCHGFTGNRQGDGHFAPLARQLADSGIASIRIDFAGCGDSTEEQTGYTLSNMMADVDAGIAYMQANYPVDPDRIAMVGHSMGGRLASLYLDQGSYPVQAAALWSPANGDGSDGLEFLDIESPDNVAAMAGEAEDNGTVYSSTFHFTVSAALFEEMADSHPNQILAEFEGPLLLCYSGNENILSEQTIQQTVEAVQQHPDNWIKLRVFDTANHNYLAADASTPETARLDGKLRDVTLAFLQEALLELPAMAQPAA